MLNTDINPYNENLFILILNGFIKKNLFNNIVTMKISKRFEHIQLLESSLLNDTRGVSKEEIELLNKVIIVLQFISNSEYQQLYDSFKETDKQSFMVELTEFLIKDKRWSKITSKRQEEYEELRKIYNQRENRDFKAGEYMQLLESAISKQS